MPFWWVRTFAGLLIVVGQLFLFYALWETGREREVTPVVGDRAAA
jgi:hypothetical protein